MIKLGPLGDRAFLARFATEDEAAGWAAAVRARGWPGVEDVVLAYQTAAVHADPDAIDLGDLERRLRAIEPSEAAQEAGGLVRLPMLYDGDDLADVARRLGMTEAGVVAEHSGREYRV